MRRRWPGLLCAVAFVGFPAMTIAAGVGEGHLSQAGFPGVLETPTAFMPAEGSLGFGISSGLPYRHLYLNMQVFPGLNFGARYNEITNERYADGDQTNKDKSFDIALRIFDGSGGLPAVSVGLLDIGGTQYFGGEYVVASQRYYDFYSSLGIGWGRLGSAADFANPLAEISNRFASRPGRFDRETGGQVAYQNWFRGKDVAMFGSLMWRPSDWPRWSFLAEMEGNDYSFERSTEPIEQDSRFNFGVDYALNDYATLGLSYLRGNQLGFRLGIQPIIGSDSAAAGKAHLPPLQSDLHPSYRAALADGQTERLAGLYDALAQQGFYAHAMDLSADRAVFTIWQSNNAGYRDPAYVLRFVGRMAIDRLPEVTQVRVVTMAGGIPALSAQASRRLIEEEARGQVGEDEFVLLSQYGPADGGGADRARYPDLLSYPSMLFGLTPALRSSIGGPEEFYLGQLLLKPSLTVQLTPRLAITGLVGVSILNDLDRASAGTSGTLPPVRGDLEKYQSGSGDVFLDRLDANYLFPIAPEWYGRLSAGIFEEMYGGVGSEVLYRPFDKRWAVGVNANYVRKRGFEQRFDFLDYETATGHVTWYYRSPFEGVTAKVSAGRYLAKDIGVTVDISREFRNGASFGVFATKTDVSSKEFGEGSFDKGIYITIPLQFRNKGLDANSLTVNYRFLPRDGGQKVRDGRELYGIYGRYDAGAVYEH
jgi:hypothetical protein